ncbi:hypothetical protein [Roseateles koreensis]|uniref:Uncharacterized protein n=1 Tax=Roseateles koreensis TaxID=2987526 RepID=A0ABT5KM65_9BURK|nr:hypothetical protein [Roseateles koreensis]MDC8784004.1 hypothetical protein [Roseateles koreensis]
MSPKSVAWIERLVWIFIYAGMLLGTLGLFVIRQGIDDVLGQRFGLCLVGLGALGVVAGVLLIWLRSRIKVD